MSLFDRLLRRRVVAPGAPLTSAAPPSWRSQVPANSVPPESAWKLTPATTGDWTADAERSVVRLSGAIDDELSNTVVAAMLFQLGRGKKEIDLVVSSPGGSVVCALAIIDTMAEVATTYSHVIRTWAIGSNAGMAVWIIAAGSQGERRMATDGTLSLVPLTSPEKGAVDAREIEALHDRLTSELATQTRATAMDVISWMGARRTFSVDEAIEVGLVDSPART